MRNKDVKIYAGDVLLISAKAGKKAVLRIKRKSDIGIKLEDALHAGKIRLS